MSRSISQIRPKGDPSAPVYAPQRDLANLFLPLLKEVFSGLDKEHWNPYFTSWFEREGLTENDIGRTVIVITNAVQLFIRDRTITSPADAFLASGLGETPDAVRYAVFSRLGEHLLAGFFVALRDVTPQGGESPLQSDMAQMIAAGRELSERLSGPLANYPVSQVGTDAAMSTERLRVIQQLQGIQAELESNLGQVRLLAAKQKPVVAAVRHVTAATGWSRWCRSVAFAWRLFWGKYADSV